MNSIFSMVALVTMLTISNPASAFFHPIAASKVLELKLKNAKTDCEERTDHEQCSQKEHCYWGSDSCRFDREKMLGKILRGQLIRGIFMIAGYITVVYFIGQVA